MGIFSSTHRALAREAFSCIGRRVTLRPCDTGFQEKIQGQLMGWLMNRSVPLARFVRKHFEVLAWVFFILTVWSLFATAQGVYNFYFYGSCNGLNAASFCVLDPTGSNNAISGIDIGEDLMPPPCGEGGDTGTGYLSNLPLTLANYPVRVGDAVNTVTMIGCYECKYTRETYPTIRRLIDTYEPTFTFIHHPTKATTGYLTAVTQCVYEASAGNEWLTVVDGFFAAPAEALHEESNAYDIVARAGFDREAIAACAAAEGRADRVFDQRQEVVNTGIYGTPLIFVNDTPIVGPKPYRVYRHLLD